MPACGPGFDYIIDSFPLGEALTMIFQGSGECADVDWVFMGLSMPTWTLIWIVALGTYSGSGTISALGEQQLHDALIHRR